MAQQLSVQSWPARFQLLPKAELHLHLEGTMEPATVVALAQRYGDLVTADAVAARYATRDFAAFIEAYKWVTSYLRVPADYALVARARLAEQLLAQNVVYAEVTLFDRRDALAQARRRRQLPRHPRSRRAVRGPRAAHAVDLRRRAPVRCRRRPWRSRAAPWTCDGEGVIAYGIGGDELAVPAAEFRPVYEFVGRPRPASPGSCRRNRRPGIGPRCRRIARRRTHRPRHRRGCATRS